MAVVVMMGDGGGDGDGDVHANLFFSEAKDTYICLEFCLVECGYILVLRHLLHCVISKHLDLCESFIAE